MHNPVEILDLVITEAYVMQGSKQMKTNKMVKTLQSALLNFSASTKPAGNKSYLNYVFLVLVYNKLVSHGSHGLWVGQVRVRLEKVSGIQAGMSLSDKAAS